ncbi:hypothetical protein LTR78_008381 [Recurvomyces mirabilis]|uniref:Major facilitator superfamily (MFS) profile domain-containing protein n=1 Tax=Recurvomyces mirabilis TaxID=574656 RepID=A0AAE0TUQ8_9PEZI|nr:hypothetical protein LTR78_008381 [Recurvomyces mirabilis]
MSLPEKAGIQAESIELAKPTTLHLPNHTGDVDLLDSTGKVRRIPIPSADPNDPLNLSKWRKLGIIITTCFYAIFSLVLVGGAGSILPFWIALYAPQGKSIQQVVNLTTYPSLVMALDRGAGAFVMLPCSIMFGRRPVLLGCCALIFASTIGAAKSTTYNSHMACRILQGIATGATESVLPLIISDISFLDERGLLFACYWGFQNFIGNIFTITVGFLVAETSWRWFYWLLTILGAVGFALIFFLVPETRYSRSPMAMEGQVCYTDEFGHTMLLTDAEARERFGATLEGQANNEFGPRVSYVRSLNPVTSAVPNAFRVGGGALVKMVSSLSSPGVIWAILATSISLGVTIAMSLTYGEILTTDFGWSMASVGLINCGGFPAAIVAMALAGPLSDKLILYMASRRGGVHRPEDILITLAFPSLVSAIGIIIYGVTAQNPAAHSAWGIIMGWTLFNIGFIVALVTGTHFAAEAYPQNPGPALVMVVGSKNIVSFAASFGIIPLVHRFNYLTAYMILLGAFCGIFLLGIPVYFLNPKWRAMVGKKQTE